MVLVIMIMAQVLGSECHAPKGYSFQNIKPGVAWQLPLELPMCVVHCSTFGHYAVYRCEGLMTAVNCNYYLIRGCDSVVNIIPNARCTRDMKSRTVMVKATFGKKTLFTSKLDLNLGKKLVKCYVWSIALYRAETDITESRSKVYSEYMVLVKDGEDWLD